MTGLSTPLMRRLLAGVKNPCFGVVTRCLGVAASFFDGASLMLAEPLPVSFLGVGACLGSFLGDFSLGLRGLGGVVPLVKVTTEFFVLADLLELFC